MKKYIGNFLSIASVVLAIIVIGLYAATMAKTTSSVSEPVFYLIAALAIVLVIAGNVLPVFKEIALILACGVMAAALGIFANGQMSNLGYYFHGIHDIGDGIIPAFVAAMILGIIGLAIDITLVYIKPNSLLDLIKHK